MKILLCFILFSMLNVSGSIFSQSATFDFAVNGKTVKEVFKDIKSQSTYRFLYNDDFAGLNRNVSFNTKDNNIEEVLNELLTGAHLTYRELENDLIVITPIEVYTQQLTVSGTISDAETGEPLPGASILVQGTTIGTVTDNDGYYSLSVPDRNVVLEFSFVGYLSEEIMVGQQDVINVMLQEDVRLIDEIVVVGYGTQRRSDITGTVASLPQERLEMVPNLNIAQAIQGSIPGISITTTSSGAAPSQAIMVRGRNSIRASNSPLIVVDAVPYGGSLRDINPNDVESIEILKDASAAAIYGSRGSNGVILITTKDGFDGAPQISYDGYYSIQNHIDYPEYMSGDEFYEFKQIREPGVMTASEQAIYEAGEWVDWYEEGSRQGETNQHNLSVAGGFADTKYYIAGNVLNVKGIAINDDYLRLTGRINIDTEIADWLTIGTRTNYSFDDRSGISPRYDYPEAMLSRANPLTTAYDDDGNISIFIWPEDSSQGNPLSPILYDNKNIAHQIVSNNFAIIDFPFATGLSYRINVGIRNRFGDSSTYKGRDTREGLVNNGIANTSLNRSDNTIIENILSYTRDIGEHNIFATGVYSYEHNNYKSNNVSASGFPHDFLTYYSAGQANYASPSYSFSESVLFSQMLRLNYTYDSRYLFTLTGRRDGFSGFGADTKWGIFPSAALGWNLANEVFFPWQDTFNELKPRISIGLNGNQAVGVYETLSRLGSRDWVSGKTTQAGYSPSRLGQEDLGWESSRTFNVGVDYGIMNNRFQGDINYFMTNTFDLLLNRTISPVHGITSITENIGETANRGVEFLLNSRNVSTPDFSWFTSFNFSYAQNEIVSLYGILDEEGEEVDDIGNQWFIGEPIRVSYDFIWDGVWQLDEAEEAAEWGSIPGDVKLRDVNNDGQLTAEDRQILGQNDPTTFWGMTNSFSYRNFKLDIFVHGSHGNIRNNPLMEDGVWENVRLNTTKKNWWTPDNPTNEWIRNDPMANFTGGHRWLDVYEDADFIRLKDVTLSYTFPRDLIEGVGFDGLRLYVNGRNLLTITEYGGLDPELSSQLQYPLQREIVFGMNFSF